MENVYLLIAAEEPVSGFPSASLEEAGRSWCPPKDAGNAKMSQGSGSAELSRVLLPSICSCT